MQVPFIRAEDVEHRLDWLRMVEAIRQGSQAATPQIADQMLRHGPDILLSRAAWIGGMGVAVKSVTVLPGNPSRGLPSVHGALVLFDDASGQVMAIIDSGLVTKWKTAADSLLGASLLARKDSRNLLIVGAGAVAQSLVDAYRALFPGIAVTLWNRSPAKVQALARQTGAEMAGDLALAAGQADIICTATMSSGPVIRGEWLRPGTHLDLIGAFTPTMREVDDAAIARARVFVDCRETTIAHIGEIMIPLANGTLSQADILGDLRDLVRGRAGRLAETDITLFKNGGGAHLDLMTGRAILAEWQRAQQA